jgi:hypothetical protein
LLSDGHKRDLNKIIGECAEWSKEDFDLWDPHKAIDELHDDMFPRAEGCWPFG